MLTLNDIKIVSVQLQRPELNNISDKILSFNPTKYLSAGTHVTCFVRDTDNIVIKCCQCAPETILKNENLFVEQTTMLQSHNFPILPYIEYMTTDHNYIIYTQQLCTSLTELDVNLIICGQILDFVHLMLNTGIKISDIFYKNFGLISNKLYFYDYHNVEQFITQSNGCSNGFLVKNLYCLFTRLGININPNNEWKKCLDIKDILSRQLATPEENYGQCRFPRSFHKLLVSLVNNDIEKSKHYLEKCISYVNNEINKTIFNLSGNVRQQFMLPKFVRYINLILQNNKEIKTIVIDDLNTIFDSGIIQLAFMNPYVMFILKSTSLYVDNIIDNKNIKNLITKNIKIIPEYNQLNNSFMYIQSVGTIKSIHNKGIYIVENTYNSELKRELRSELKLNEIIKFSKMIVKIENENYLIYI